MRLTTPWHRWFLAERPSLMLGVFRIAVAVTVGCHVIPSFFHLADNYLATAFREYNPSFFPLWVLQLVDRSPDVVVVTFVGLFLVAWLGFLLGAATQLSALLMTAACYYFYARNSLHIGTLSFDILLVTLSLVWVTGYPGDWLSVGWLRRGDPLGYRRTRPFFIQRLLQLQLAWTYWYTAFAKITAQGNWLTDNPYHALMCYPAMGVVRDFPGRAFLAQHPDVCYGLGITIILGEIVLPCLWFIRRTRLVGLALGFVFHVLLLVTLHVPTIFFFLFPPQMLLFLDPEDVVAWIDRRRARQAARGRATLLYDGGCGFCLASIRRLQGLDLFGRLELVDFHRVPDLTRLHPALTPGRCHSRMQLVEPDGRLSEGFWAFRRLSVLLPLLWPLAPGLRLPGMGWVGPRIYDAVARRRFLFHAGRRCRTNQCGVVPDDAPSSLNT